MEETTTLLYGWLDKIFKLEFLAIYAPNGTCELLSCDKNGDPLPFPHHKKYKLVFEDFKITKNGWLDGEGIFHQDFVIMQANPDITGLKGSWVVVDNKFMLINNIVVPVVKSEYVYEKSPRRQYTCRC